MKKIIFLIIAFLSVTCVAQETIKQQTVKQLGKEIENSKSGNYKDVLAGFLQLAATNFTGADKSIEMNTTLFAIKVKANPKLETGNFQPERFSRNFQFNFKLNLDDKYKYTGFTGGFTYALINDRDRRLAVLTNTIYGQEFQKYREIVLEIQSEINENIKAEISDDALSNIELNKLEKVIIDISNSVPNDKTKPQNKYYDIVIAKFKEKAEKIKYFNNQDIATYADYLNGLEENEFEKIDAKSLWTFSADGTSGETGKFNKASVSSVFLKGIPGKNEIDIRAKFIYSDTLVIGSFPRTEFKSTAGVNFKWYTKDVNVENQKSYFEIKCALEYNSILKNILATEKKDNFLANAEIRIRVTNDLWFPLIVKYDIEKANFLGFLNVTYNFEGFK
jgi:hypothetical protein